MNAPNLTKNAIFAVSIIRAAPIVEIAPERIEVPVEWRANFLKNEGGC